MSRNAYTMIPRTMNSHHGSLSDHMPFGAAAGVSATARMEKMELLMRKESRLRATEGQTNLMRRC